MTKRRLSVLSRSIAGKVALVTGAASGIGRATVHLFADEGANVAVQDVNASGVEATVREITDAGGIAAGFVADLGDPANIPGLVDQVVAKFAALDILVNNAGVSRPAPIVAQDYEAAWERTIAVNLAAQMRLIRAALPHLMKSGAGRIVNIASTEGLGATAGASPYTASKHGVVGLTRSLAVELGSQGVTVNCVCPGPINTGMTAPIPDEAKRKFARRRVPLRRYGEPEEVAQITLSIVLPASSYLNGAIIPVDGGLIVQNT
jgi:3-oxoacyl-[acyl-carrier protein] reductase